jgi:hypothetical protein
MRYSYGTSPVPHFILRGLGGGNASRLLGEGVAVMRLPYPTKTKRPKVEGEEMTSVRKNYRKD